VLKKEGKENEESENKESEDASLARRLVNPLTAKAGKPVNDLSELLKDKNASKLFLNLLSPLNPNYLNSKDIAYLTTQKKIEQVKENEENAIVTKKPLAVRRAQILKHLLLPLLNSMTTHMSELLRCLVASKIVLETLVEASRQLNPLSTTQEKKEKDEGEKVGKKT